MPTFVAFLRAVNVGKRKYPMAELREALTDAGFEEVETHIQTGNVLFRTSLRSRAKVIAALEKAMRSWATLDPLARSAVQAIDRRRLNYVEKLLRDSGLSPQVARPRAQILYWAFLGFAQSEKPLPPKAQQAVLEELLGIAAR